jgi:hypothetical protein
VPAQREFPGECVLVDLLKQPTAQCIVDVECGSDDVLGEVFMEDLLISVHLCLSVVHRMPVVNRWFAARNLQSRICNLKSSVVCRGQDLNLQAVKHLALNQACLPISPPRRDPLPTDGC